MDKNIIISRVEALRDVMRRMGVHAFIIPSSDPHCGEYVPAHWQSREWISGFNGSAGTAVVTLNDARLWTDSRYFIAATEQLEGTPFRLMRDGCPGTPSIADWLCDNLPPSVAVAVDGWSWDYGTLADIEDSIARRGMTLRTDADLIDRLWTDRPEQPLNPIEIQPLEYTGESAFSKIERLRSKVQELGAAYCLLCTLDDIAWICNIRSNDVHCTPLAVAYMSITPQEATLYTDERKVSDEVRKTLANEGICVMPYNEVDVDYGAVVMSASACNYMLVKRMKDRGCMIIDANPVAGMKAVKNEVEIEGFRRAMRRDGVAMVRFYRWLESHINAQNEITELTVDEVLTAYRAEQPLFRGLSFDTIAGYAEHGAIVHYEATPESAAVLQPHGLLLLDSGAQYQDGTTDITRTIPLGPLTEQECVDYTLVLKGHIALAKLRFPEGISGTRIDAFARYALWQHGMDYGHGTGHGVGSYLSVHEGPHQIRHSWKPAGLVPGMTVTNEPGLYREGCHGVRIENTMLVVSDGETEFGRFCRLEPLTLCPIDRAPIVMEMLTPDEIAYLNAYHQYVYDELSPLLDDAEKDWLREATKKYACD